MSDEVVEYAKPPSAPVEVQLRQAVERICDDRRGLHWSGLDSDVLTDLHENVEREFAAVLGSQHDTEPPAPELPTVGGFVQLPQAWHSSAGIIQNLVEHACGGVGVLSSRKGSMRAYHWHKSDWHYLYIISGLVDYEEWPYDQEHASIGMMRYQGKVLAREPLSGEPMPEFPKLELTRLEIGPGQMVFTPPLRSHRLMFREDTVMISISKLSRQHAEHEADVQRLP